MKIQSISALLLINLALLADCDDRMVMAVRDDGDPMQYGSVSRLNYIPYYIHTFSTKGHDDNDISGGGSNIMPAIPDNAPSGGGKGTCCASFPKKWYPGLKVTVRWTADKRLGDVTYGLWHEVEAEMPEYGAATYGMWIVFLPGNRVKIMIKDDSTNRYNHVELVLLMMTLMQGPGQSMRNSCVKAKGVARSNVE